MRGASSKPAASKTRLVCKVPPGYQENQRKSDNSKINRFCNARQRVPWRPRQLINNRIKR